MTRFEEEEEEEDGIGLRVAVCIGDKGIEEAGSESTESNVSVSGTPEEAHPFYSRSGSSSVPLAADEVVSQDVQWSFEALPDDFHKSPEPLPHLHLPTQHNSHYAHTNIHLEQIQENAVCQDDTKVDLSPSHSLAAMQYVGDKDSSAYFTPYYTSSRLLCDFSKRIFLKEEFAVATWIGFWSLLFITMGVSTITPIRDAVALQLGVKHMPKLTLASSVMAFLSSVPIGWLFEAPDPSRRKLWKKMGLTRGETQGSSLALFYRFFALAVTSYAVGFTLVDLVNNNTIPLSWFSRFSVEAQQQNAFSALLRKWLPILLAKLGEIMYIAFFLVVHLMKLHAISLVWGVTTEAMEYEDVARKAKEQRQHQKNHALQPPANSKTRTRLQRLAMVGFGGTLGGIGGRYVFQQTSPQHPLSVHQFSTHTIPS